MQDNPWMALLTFVGTQKPQEFPGVDPLTMQTLEWILGRSVNSSDPIFIQTVVTRSGISSPATTYKSLEKLRALGFIDIVVDAADGRRRILRPSRKTHHALSRLTDRTRVWIKARR